MKRYDALIPPVALRHLLATALGLLLIGMVETARAQQSSDRDNPAPLTVNEVRGQGIGREVEYYYTFLAGPGEVILTADARAKSYSTAVEVELFNMEAQRLEIIRFAPASKSERRMSRLQLGQQQPVLLRIVLDSNAGDYLVRLGGAVQLTTAAALSPTPLPQDGAALTVPNGATTVPADPAATTTVTTETTPTTPPADPTTIPATTVPATTVPATTDASGVPTTDASAGKVSRFQKLWTRLGAAGELLGLSNLGKLRVEMKDGTAQEISLLKVKKVFAPKGADPNSPEPTNESWQRLWMKLGGAGELMSLASSGAMKIELRDGSTQQFDLAKVKKVSLKK